MGARSSKITAQNNRSDGHLLEYFRNTFVRGGGGTNASTLQGLTATGGVISDYTVGPAVYRAHIFTSSGTFDVSAIGDYPADVEYLVVAGGGAGGGTENGTQGGGGGGAGGLRTNLSGHPLAGSAFPVSVSPYPITVGAGGAGAPGARGNAGNPSTFGPITSTGGGGGLSAGSPYPGRDTPIANAAGGSGGGVSWYTYGNPSGPGGAGNSPPTSPPQGNPGGAGSVGPNAGNGSGASGGGGAGGAGEQGCANNQFNGNKGGNGSPIAIESATTKVYAGGGGGGWYLTPSGPGVSLSPSAPANGGGGASGYEGPGSGNGNNATYATGGGGGGASDSTPKSTTPSAPCVFFTKINPTRWQLSTRLLLTSRQAR